VTFHGPLNFLKLEYILARRGNCQDPDCCLGLETIQFTVAGTCYEFINSSNLATESYSVLYLSGNRYLVTEQDMYSTNLHH